MATPGAMTIVPTTLAAAPPAREIVPLAQAPAATVDPNLPYTIVNPGAWLSWSLGGSSLVIRTGPAINGASFFLPVIFK